MRKQTLISILFLCGLLIAEHAIFLPLIIFCYYLGNNSFREALRKTSPLFITLALYIIYFFSHATHTNFRAEDTHVFERWLFIAPQVFVHAINLILLPVHLSIDQGALIHFAPSSFSFYSFFCLVYFLVFIGFTIFSFFKWRNMFACLGMFFISLVPFLQIITSTYCLMSERYLYLPLFFLVFGIGCLIKEKKNAN